MIAVLMVVAFVLTVHYVVIRPLASMVKTSKALAEGDIDEEIQVSSNDEVGDLGAAYSGVVDYIHEIAGVTKRIACGDLTVEIKPRSERDVLSNSIAQMVANQRQLMGRVKNTASVVAEASRQLSTASEQTAQATQQIASAIQQIAKGAAEQAASLQETTNGMEQLSGAIEQIAKGAQVQAGDVEEASASIKKVSMAIGNVSVNAKAGDEEWGSTAASAAQGARKAQETAAGMDRIKKAMEA